MSRTVSTYHLKKVTALVLALVLLLTGGAIGLFTARQSVSSVLQEHDNHMLDLVKTVDHNAAFVLSRCKNSLEKLILSEAASGEAEALSAGDVQKLATDVSSSSFF